MRTMLPQDQCHLNGRIDGIKVDSSSGRFVCTLDNVETNSWRTHCSILTGGQVEDILPTDHCDPVLPA